MKQLVKGVVLATVVFMTINLAEKTCLAANKKDNELSMTGIQYTNDGGNVSIKEYSHDSFNVIFNTKGEKEGYYTVSIYAPKKIRIKDKSVISFAINAKTDVALNLSLMTEEWKTLKCTDGASVYLKQENSKTYELVTVANGKFQLKKGFKGMIYVPLSSVGSKNQLAKVNKFGVYCVQQQDVKTSFDMGKAEVLGEHELEEEGLENSYQVMGNLTPLLPACGEYVYEYQIARFDKEDAHIPFEFALANNVQGVNVSKNGIIAFFDFATVEPVKLRITVNKEFSFYYTIYPEESWFMKQEEATFDNFIVPSPETATNYAYAVTAGNGSLNLDYVIRVILLGAAFSYLMFYYLKIRNR